MLNPLIKHSQTSSLETQDTSLLKMETLTPEISNSDAITSYTTKTLMPETLKPSNLEPAY